MRLEQNWDEFKNKVNDFISKGENLVLNYTNSKSEPDLNEFNTKYKEWQKSLVEYFQQAFDDENNDYAQHLKHPNHQRFTFDINPQKSFEKQIYEKREDALSLVKDLKYFLRVLGISDAVIRPDEIDLEKRKKFTTDETLDLILHKLYNLYDNSYHPITNILEGNGIELGRHGEERELIKILENKGFLNCQYAKNISAQLTVEGKRYVENKLKSETTDYEKIDKSQEELNSKIDEIVESLKKQSFGQQIIFDELEELKDLYSKLDKKNWGQVLKGKLIDLGIAQVINKEVMETIFKELTDQILRLN